ncbi:MULTISPECIES: peptidylprolyl isomerase [Thalassospira]|uniref:Parvulin-like PPIase n=2 Tax=Thalassospira TaxID=168934 RepID=A0A367W1J9_9PROT|nr:MULTISPECIES: peptidylprolyl isomerase [Thalassospira]MDG4721239.1 peptidylprolyl isomerase [Thalassospira sp. FZY0004]RCK33659.1 peptidylprolyl isomerase [Thalassospira profundimaris]
MISKLSNFKIATVCAVVSAVAIFSLTAPVKAQSPVGVAAVVNDDPISIIDLVERIKLVAVSSNIQMTPEKSNEIAPQILQQLINETLQMQEAERRGIEVTDEDVARGKSMIEQNAGLPDGQLDAYLTQRRIAPGTIENQIRPQVAWQKLLGSMRSQVEISEAEIDDSLQRIINNQGKPRNRVQEIFLPVDNPQDSTQVYHTAQEVLGALKQGADFSALARQFSASASAANGGDLGWLYSGELSSDLQQVVNQLEPGKVSAPVQTIRGYYIIKLLDRRVGDEGAITDTRLDLYQLFVPLSAQMPKDLIDAKLALLRNTQETANSCQDLANVAVEIGSEMSGEMKGISPQELSGPVGQAVTNLNTGKASNIVQVDGGALMIMICNKTEESNLPGRQDIENKLKIERLDILARRKLRELRRQAFIDIRM